MKAFTTEQLIAAIQRIISIPSDIESEGKADQDLMDTLDTVMMDEIVPQILKLQEDYLTRTITLNVSSTPNLYPVPKRAIGNSLRDVFFQNGTAKEYLVPITREFLPFYSSDPADVPDGFYFEGDNLVLVPPGSAGTLKLSFFFRPGQLVKAASYRQVTAVDTGTNTITVDSTVPTAWTTATLFDVHSKESGAENRVFDYGASGVSGTTITFDSAIDGSVDATRGIQVGDYVVEAENAAVPSIPRDAHPALAQAAACRLLESDGDSEMLKAARQTLGRQLENFGHLFETRVDGKPPTIVNRKSLLFAQRRGGGWR